MIGRPEGVEVRTESPTLSPDGRIAGGALHHGFSMLILWISFDTGGQYSGERTERGVRATGAFAGTSRKIMTLG
jgi:hypothetical protein